MFYYRHMFRPDPTGKDDLYYNFYPSLSKLGFIGRNGEDISTYYATNDNTIRYFKYSKDLNENPYYFSYKRGTFSNGQDNNFIFYNNARQTASTTDCYTGIGIIFIPLKNNGFYMNVIAPPHGSDSFSQYNIPSPPIYLTRQHESQSSVNSPRYRSSGYCLNLFYLFPNVDDIGASRDVWLGSRTSYAANSNSDWIITGGLGYVYAFTDSYYCINHAGTRGNGWNVDQFNDFIDPSTNTRLASTGYDYVDVNSNVCVLTKIPYNNGFCDNMFAMTTAPQEIFPARFFSFGGRNFMNVWDNLVLELPNN